MDSPKKTFLILNLGAGVQSTALYLMFAEGLLTPSIDVAIFADTGDEPQAVYDHLDWLRSLNGPRILIRSKGSISEHLSRGENSTGQRFASIPAFTLRSGGDARRDRGQLRRQCSKEYKSEVIERAIRRDVVGLKPRQRIPKHIQITQVFGISLDEAGRAKRIERRLSKSAKWSRPVFPLISLGMTRAACRVFLSERVPHKTPRSACWHCPFHSDTEWQHLKDSDPTSFSKAVELDRILRQPGRIVNRGLNQPLYLHSSCQPLDSVTFSPETDPRAAQLSLSFTAECEGMCGL